MTTVDYNHRHEQVVKFLSVDILITFTEKGTEQYGLALDSALLWEEDGTRGLES